MEGSHKIPDHWNWFSNKYVLLKLIPSQAPNSTKNPNDETTATLNLNEQIENEMSQNKFEQAKDILLEFISNNPTEIKAINFYLDCLLELKQFDEIDEFIGSLNKEMQEKDEIKQIEKKVNIIKNNLSGPK